MAQQLQDADALKIKAHFFKLMVAYLNSLSYSIDYPISTMYDCWTKVAALSSTCLTYEQECMLKAFADTLPDEVTTPPTITPCGDQVAISIAEVPYPCNYAFGMSNPLFLTENTVQLTLIPDSIYHKAEIMVNKLSNCEPYLESQIVEAGCASPLDCQDVHKPHAFTTFGLPNAITTYPNNAIKTIRLYATGQYGDFNPLPINLDISPANAAAWSACPTCTLVTPANLEFGSPNFKYEFEALMENITKSLWGDIYVKCEVIVNGDDLAFVFYNKHKPASYWMSPHKPDFRLTHQSQAPGSGPLITKIFNNGVDIVTLWTVTHFYEGLTFALECNPSWNAIVDGYVSFQPAQSSNFYTYVPTSYTVPNTLILAAGATTCFLTTLTATYTVSSSVVSTEWRDSFNNIIATNSDTIFVENSGFYSFYITTSNGCVESQTYTYEA